MKKILLIISVISVISVLFLVGCSKKDDIVDTHVSGDENLWQENNNLANKENSDMSNEEDKKEVKNKYILTNSDNDYIIENSSNSLINNDTILISLSLNELDIARNEIFARHGHDFKSNELKEYFKSKLWYSAIDNKSVAFEELSEIEKENISIIDNRINKLKKINASLKKFEYDESKPVVYTFYEQSKYKFPYININSNEINEINNKIHEWACTLMVKNDDSKYNEGLSCCERANYYYNENSGILSIVIIESENYGGESGFFYNIDKKSGKILSNEEVLALHGISKSDFMNLKHEIVTKSVSKRLGEDELNENDILKINEFLSGRNDALKMPNTDDYEKGESDKWGNLYYHDLIVYDTVHSCNYNEPNDLKLIYFDNNSDMHIVVEVTNLAGTTDNVPRYLDCKI